MCESSFTGVSKLDFWEGPFLRGTIGEEWRRFFRNSFSLVDLFTLQTRSVEGEGARGEEESSRGKAEERERFCRGGEERDRFC